MILRILIIVFVCIIVLMIAFWLLTGGLSRGLSFASSINNPLDIFTGSSTGVLIHLPGQPDSYLPGVDISAYAGSESDQDARGRLNELQDQYNQLYTLAKDPKNFGNPSPYRDQISFGTAQAQENAAASEYLSLEASYQNTSPVSLAGWSLQSAVTGIRVAIPAAAPSFVSGILNSTAPLSLEPGVSAIVVSGPSPVGVSFRENMCTGYLAETQQFTPDLYRACPSGENELPLTAENIRIYGDLCVDYVKGMPQCYLPGRGPLPDVTPACKDFLLNRFTYNGCVTAHRNESGFASATWRVYLGSSMPLWRDTHDVIRLLDESGRTVDVLTY